MTCRVGLISCSEFNNSWVIIFVLFLFQTSQGTLQLSLPGFDHIPSNGAVLISDVGTIEDGRALICRHNATDTRPAGVLDEWYYMYGTEQEQRVEDHDSDLGWRRNRDEDNGIYVVRLGSIVSMAAVGASQEGVYSCVVPTTDTDFDHVEVGLYYSITRVEVVIEVISQQSQEYNVTCMSEGGSVQSSSFTGPAGEEDLGHLQPVEEEPDMRGADNYSISVVRTGGTHGDTFQCMASNGASTATAIFTLSVSGSPLNVSVVEVSTLRHQVNVSWSPPSDGASVTSYVVHYRSLLHEGTLTVFQNTSVLIDGVIAEGRFYEIIVEAQSRHLSGYSLPVPFGSCCVPKLGTESIAPNSISLFWEDPDCSTGSITGLIKYTVVPNGDTVWLYVEGNSKTLTALSEFTNYTIEMAFFDRHDILCEFSEPVLVKTGLGPVQNLITAVSSDEIQILWSSPNVTDGVIIFYQVEYFSTRAAEPVVTTVTSQSVSLSIPASQGDQYSVTVTAHTETGPGDSSTITAGVDYLAFEVQLSGVRNCTEWAKSNPAEKTSDIDWQITDFLQTQCNCDADIRDTLLYCSNGSQQNTIFRGRLFSPPSSKSSYLFNYLEDWVAVGARVNVKQYLAVDATCQLPSATADSESDDECFSTGEPTQNTMSATDASEGKNLGDVPIVQLAAVAGGGMVIGMLLLVVIILVGYILRKHCLHRKRGIYQERALVSSSTLINNPHYLSLNNLPRSNRSTLSRSDVNSLPRSAATTLLRSTSSHSHLHARCRSPRSSANHPVRYTTSNLTRSARAGLSQSTRNIHSRSGSSVVYTTNTNLSLSARTLPRLPHTQSIPWPSESARLPTATHSLPRPLTTTVIQPGASPSSSQEAYTNAETETTFNNAYQNISQTSSAQAGSSTCDAGGSIEAEHVYVNVPHTQSIPRPSESARLPTATHSLRRPLTTTVIQPGASPSSSQEAYTNAETETTFNNAYQNISHTSSAQAGSSTCDAGGSIEAEHVYVNVPTIKRSESLKITYY